MYIFKILHSSFFLDNYMLCRKGPPSSFFPSLSLFDLSPLLSYFPLFAENHKNGPWKRLVFIAFFFSQLDNFKSMLFTFCVYSFSLLVFIPFPPFYPAASSFCIFRICSTFRVLALVSRYHSFFAEYLPVPLISVSGKDVQLCHRLVQHQ